MQISQRSGQQRPWVQLGTQRGTITGPMRSAMRLCLLLSPLFLLACDGGREVQTADPDWSESRLHEHIKTLAADDFQGRAPGTEGGAKTVEYLVRHLEGMGLSPGNQGNFTQTVPLLETTLVEEPSLEVSGEEGEWSFSYGEEMMAWSGRQEDTVSLEDAELVFVGYGTVAPEYDWDDYAELDVEGKIVVTLINDPGFATGDEDLFNGEAMTYYGRWTYKLEEAARQGAAGALIIHEDAAAGYGWSVVSGSWSGPQLNLEQEDDDNDTGLDLEGWLSQDSAEALFAAQGLDLATMQAAALEPEFAGHSMDAWASIEMRNEFDRFESDNVIATVPGSERPDEYIVYTAHWDHLGVSPDDPDKIYNGAVDNASGSAALLELAQAFSDMDPAPQRSVVFLWVTAEEQGLLGSQYYAENPVFPLAQTVAGINLDSMNFFGPTEDITVVGYGNSELDNWLREAAEAEDRYLRPESHPERGYFYRSDHFSLARQGVPVLYPNPGIDMMDGGEAAGRAHLDDYQQYRYHQPEDEYDPDWDLSGLVADIHLVWRVGLALAQNQAFPNWAEDNEFRRIRDESRQAAGNP